MQRCRPFRVSWTAAVVLATLVAPACFGPKLKYDADRLQRKCAVDGRTEITLDQARCVAKVAGLKESRKCPFELTEVVRETEGPVIEVRETCSTLGMDIAKSTGEVVGVELGEGAAR